MIPTISIAICTYNRASLLKKCLEALLPQINTSNIDIIIVDNNSNDTTRGLIETYQNKHKNITYVFEKRQGLAIARNVAWQYAKGLWIAYLDDDGIPHNNYVERLQYVINHYDFDCYGGMYYAYYEKERPKWLSENFGTKRLISPNIGLIDENTLSGGIFNIKRCVLEQIGGFKENFGMSGKNVAYGEESELQYRVRAGGYKIGFDPELKMDHIVANYKHTLIWQLRREYALYRDSPCLLQNNRTYRKLLKSFLRCTIKVLPTLIGKFIKTKDYYWQNLVLDYLKPMIAVYGTMNNQINTVEKCKR
ncbi:glycosyltransferase family 2 protein [Confluentibacter citreus]|uniref:glycosyltransferase family 2 protein n=1 Tax=Confluentibacter citreus TaxID=2007307 RepID=UPI000C28D718|nr:glycosyltransferase [Confluentibacter citreus]